ncbi:MAG TPA: AarF/UbiB family protein, partial [Fimbriimonas sp.]
MAPARRTAEIARVLSKYGFDWLAQSHSPWRFVALPKVWFGKSPTARKPENVRLALEELGTTYIKLGQAISTRTDLVPPDYVAELAKLQDDAPPIPYEEVAEVIRSELGASPDLIFRNFEREPVAAASIGQVHRAEREDGTRIVVKVQRPGTEEQV